MKALHFLVSGRVQGVGFRWYAVRSAERHGISGWVRNSPDGRVEAFAQGEAGALAAFRLDLERGPSASTVEGIEEHEVPPAGEIGGFNVRF